MDATNPQISDDLPPLTWPQRWRAFPGYIRIGWWTFLALIGLHVLLVVRWCVGLIEPTEIGKLRDRGADVRYAWEIHAEPFPGYRLLMDGLAGRSHRNVVWVRMQSASAADSQLVCSRFPNLRVLWLKNASLSDEALASLSRCRKLESLDLSNTDLNDQHVKHLAELRSLIDLYLSNTLISDVAIPPLQRLKQIACMSVLATDLTPAAIQSWAATLKSGSHIDSDDYYQPHILLGTIRWSDGGRTRTFPGDYEIRLEGPLCVAGSCQEIVRGSTLQPDALVMGWWSAQDSGFFQLTLKLNQMESAPVVFHVDHGLPDRHSIEFHMPVTKEQALQAARESSAGQPEL